MGLNIRRRRDPGRPLTDAGLLIVYAWLVWSGVSWWWAATVILGTELWERFEAARAWIGVSS